MDTYTPKTEKLQFPATSHNRIIDYQVLQILITGLNAYVPPNQKTDKNRTTRRI